MRKLLLALFFAIVSFAGFTQSIESLIAQSEKIKVEKGEKSQEYLTMLDSIVQVANRAEKLDICYQYREKHMEIVKKIYGEQSAEYADDMIRLSNTYVRIPKGPIIDVIPYYEKAVEIIKEQKRYLDFYDYTYALGLLGNFYVSDNNFEKSLYYYEQNAAAEKQKLGGGNLMYVNTLKTIGIIYGIVGKYDKSLAYREQAIEIEKKVLGENSYDYMASLEYIGDVYSAMGQYKKSLNYYERILESKDLSFNGKQIDLVSLLVKIGNIHADLENYNTALEYYAKVLERQKKETLNPDFAATLNKVGSIYFKFGNHQLALKYCEDAREIQKQIFGEYHPDYVSTIENIASIYSDLGNHKEALEYRNKSLEIGKQIYGEDHPLYTFLLEIIGIEYYEAGDNNRALECFEQVLKVRKHIYGETNPKYTSILKLIGDVYNTMGNYDMALIYYKSSLRTDKTFLNETVYFYTSLQRSIGEVYDSKGCSHKASKYYRKSLKTGKKDIKNNYCASNLIDIGITYYQLGKRQTALKYLEKALIKEKESLVNNHLNYDYALLLCSIGEEYLIMHKNTKASEYFRESFHIQRRSLLDKFGNFTTKERDLYWKKYDEIYSYIVKLCHRIPADTSITKTAFDAELLKKGLLLTSEIEFQKIIQESGDSTLLADFEKMRIIRIMLNKQYEKPIAERTLNCDSLEQVADELEKHLVRNCKEYGDYTRALALTWQDVQNALGTHDIAIEFTDVELNNDSTIYAALILTKDMESPKYVPLFEQKVFEKHLQESKSKGLESDSTRGAMDSYRNQMGAYESTALYEMVWKPLEPYFPDSARIYFAPSGMFYQIAVEYAPISETRTMSDAYEMYRVSSTKNLAMGYEPKAWTNASMYGGIEYDSDTTQMKSENGKFETRGDDELYNSTATYNSFAAMNRVVQGHKGMKYLPGTKAEVEEIQRCLKQKNISTTLYEGTKASEESFKALGGSDMTILHIATHGFYLDADTTKYKVDMSLSQTGLMFAGSNLAWTNKEIPEGVEDGILTAKEISHVDLRKTDLVVLSACQTGLGKVTGEGVFGLQRGFKNAGVKTIIMSLWSVDDFATKLMMTEFYTHLADGKSKREAFNLAQAKVRATYEDPYYWAGFIMLD